MITITAQPGMLGSEKNFPLGKNEILNREPKMRGPFRYTNCIFALIPHTHSAPGPVGRTLSATMSVRAVKKRDVMAESGPGLPTPPPMGAFGTKRSNLALLAVGGGNRLLAILALGRAFLRQGGLPGSYTKIHQSRCVGP